MAGRGKTKLSEHHVSGHGQRKKQKGASRGNHSYEKAIQISHKKKRLKDFLEKSRPATRGQWENGVTGIFQMEAKKNVVFVDSVSL